MDTEQEALGLLCEAEEELHRAVRDLGVNDWVSVTRSSQLAIEKSANVVVSYFEAYKWTHDPSEQLRALVQRGRLSQDFLSLAAFAEEAAPWHGLSTYGRWEGNQWRSPSALCTQTAAMRLLDSAKTCVAKARDFLKRRTLP